MKKIFRKALILFTIISVLFQVNIFADDDDVPQPEVTPSHDIWFYWDGGIEITPPDKTDYIEGEYLDITGLEVYGTSGVVYTDRRSEVTQRQKLDPVVDLLGVPLTLDDTVVTVSGYYSLVGMDVTGTFDITVRARTEADPTEYPYEISEVSVVSELGESIGAIPDNSSFIVDVTVTKVQERNEKDYIFVAVYDVDGVLLSLDYVRSNFPVGSECSFGFSIPAQERQIGYIKAYTWNTFGSMKPLSESKTITFE